MVLAPQGGAVSSTLPVQVSVAVPLPPSVVTGLPFWLQGVDVTAPPGNGTWVVVVRLMTLKDGSRFWTENMHVKPAPGDTKTGQVFFIAKPVVMSRMPLGRGLLLSDRAVRTWLVPCVAIRAQGVTWLAAPKDPVKSLPPSPRAPPVTKASRTVGWPTESRSPRLTPPSSPRLRRFAPWPAGPPSTGLIPRTL